MWYVVWCLSTLQAMHVQLHLVVWCVQAIESLALEDTDIKPEHIEQIKELVKKEVVLEEKESTGGASRSPP
jgi:hypothetical protein